MKLQKFCIAFLCLIFGILILPRTPVNAETRNIEGTVYTSYLSDGVNLNLTGDTTLIVNTTVRRINSITGKNYSLAIMQKSGTKGSLMLFSRDKTIPICVKELTVSAEVSVQQGTVSEADYGVLTSGNITVKSGGSLSSVGFAVGIRSSGGNILVQGGSVSASSVTGSAIEAYKKITLQNGNVTASNAGKGGAVLYANEDIYITGGSTTVEGYLPIRAKNGTISIREATVKVKATGSGRQGMLADNGSILIGGEVSVTGYIGLSAKTLVDVGSQGNLDQVSADSYGIYCEGDVWIHGSAVVTSSLKEGIYACGNITFFSGGAGIKGQKNAVWAKNGTVSVSSPLQILTPSGGVVSTHNIRTSSGADANNVMIGQKLTGSWKVELQNKTYVVGDVLSADTTGLPAGTRSYVWQRWTKKDNNTGSWVAITGAFSSTYKTVKQDNGCYLRVAVTLRNHTGVLYSNYIYVQPLHASITTQPVSQTGSVGESFTYEVSAGNAESYAWYVYDNNGTGSQAYSWTGTDSVSGHALVSGRNTSRITLIPKDRWLNGKYIACDVKGADGKVVRSYFAKMTVNDCFEEQPADDSAYVLGKLTFRTKCKGANAYHWWISDVAGGSKWSWSTVKTHADVSGEETDSVQLVPKDTWLDGKYICCLVTLNAGFNKYSGNAGITVKAVPVTAAPSPADLPAAVGTVFQDSAGASYRVTDSDPSNPAVAYVSPAGSAKGTAAIPAAVKRKKITYQVTSVAAGAFRANSKITKVTVARTVTTIGKAAFSNCVNLKTVSLGSGLVSIGKNAFNGCVSLGTVTLPKKVKKIGAGAFAGCVGLKTLTVKTAKLTDGSLGTGIFKNTYAKMAVSVPKTKLEAYRKLFRARGLNKKAGFAGF
ncbi:MAG: leucine-rich repeat protein [Blautia sp.]|nr:leucine-rich repeat protein [Blautia sp.]